MSKPRYVRGVSYPAVIVFDLLKRCVVVDLSEYAIYALKEYQWKPIYVHQTMGHLIRFMNLLNRKGNSYFEVDDCLIREIRDEELLSVMARPSSLGDSNVAMNTVNIKLIAICGWMSWLQSQGRLTPGRVGPLNCHLTIRDATPGSSGGGAIYRRYPSLYRETFLDSKHRVGLSLSRNKLEAVSALQVQNKNEYVGQRDQLVLDISIAVGWRCGSICSLTEDLFNRVEIESTSDANILIRPPVQKFGYVDTYEFPVWLALRVLSFIEDFRATLLDDKPLLAINAAGRIFLSARDCSPLKPRSMSQSASRAMRALGAEKGAGLHAGRRLFAIEAIQIEIEARLLAKQDLSTRSICETVALKLGHKNWKSLFPYVAAEMSRRGVKVTDRLQTENRDLKSENDRMKERLKKYESGDS